MARPSKYNQVITHKEHGGVLDLGQIEILAEYGLNNEQIANILNVDRHTLKAFKDSNKKLFTVLKAGRKIADSRVSVARYRRAVGYWYQETMTDSKGNITTYQKYEHPNIAAGIYHSNNMERDRWNNDQYNKETENPFPKEIIFQVKAEPTNGEEK